MVELIYRALSAYLFFRSILMKAFSHTFTSEVCLNPLRCTGNRFDACQNEKTGDSGWFPELLLESKEAR